MILACPACDSRYDVTGHPIGQQFRCRCSQVITLEAPSSQARELSCPHCGAGVAPTSSTCAHCSAQLLLKACPRCLSRVFHGHKHCPDCGSELSVGAVEETATDRVCPRCDHAMVARRVADLVIDECTACHGLFLDQIAITRVVTDRRQARAEALLGALPQKFEYERQPPGKMYIKCPICQTVMNRKLFAAGSGVVVDVCRAHGTYFDAGELPRIIDYVMQGGLEKAERKEIDRARAEVEREKHAARQVAATTAYATTHEMRGLSAGGAFMDLLSFLIR